MDKCPRQDPNNLNAGDAFEVVGFFDPASTVDPGTEPVTITVGSFKVRLFPPALERIPSEQLYRYDNPAGPLTLLELHDDGTFVVEVVDQTLTDILDPAVPVVLQIGNAVGGTTTDFSLDTPGGGIPQLDPETLIQGLWLAAGAQTGQCRKL